jgi:hypothetical protein
MPNIFNTILTGSTSIGIFLACIISAIIAGILISVIYIFTHRKETFSQSYVMSIIMLPGIVALIILLINDTSKALGLAGAFSLVRFRSVPGDPKDIAYIFFSMAVGVSCGLGYIGFAVAFIIILSAFILLLNTFRYGSPKSSSMTLKITVPENLNYQGLFDSILNENTVSWHLKRVKTVDFGTLFDLVYSIELKDGIDQKKFIDSIRTLNGNLNVTLILYKYNDQVYEK